jgi:hypothetical protein
MRKYTTISVPIEVKKQLKILKKERTWNDFLLESSNEWQQVKGERAFKKLRELLTKEDLKEIEDSSREFREKISLS